MRGRNNNRNKGPNPLTRSYESNGPDVKIRGTAQHIADKYAQLARDAQSSGDPVAAENYLQHAEHYYRIIAAAQEQFREQYGAPSFQRPFDEDGDEDGAGYGGPGERQAGQGQGEGGDIGSQPQPYEGHGERQDRFDRGERQGGERQDRGERFQGRDRFDRGDRQGGERRDRFPRHDRPRQDFQRPDYQRGEGPREDGRPEGRQDRPDFRQDQPRFDRRPRREEAEEGSVNGLPAFLTTPVRAPIAVEEPEAEAATPAAEGEAPFKARRRRRPRFEGNAGEAGADFAPESAETPPAE